jgi:tRNA(fMet)-specific endonuclease VapC
LVVEFRICDDSDRRSGTASPKTRVNPSELTKAIDQTAAATARYSASYFGRFTVSTVTLTEIVRGFQQKQSHRPLQAILVSIAAEEIIPFDQRAAELAGWIVGDF